MTFCHTYFEKVNYINSFAFSNQQKIIFYKKMPKPITFILLDESETTYGVSVKVDGVDTVQFEKNPVMFYQHNDWNMPVGKWGNVRKENGKLLADAEFDYEDDDKDVKRMIKKVEAGFIKMASCGLVDLDGIRDPMHPDDKIQIVSCRLREASIVPIGGNHNAMRLYDKDGQLIELKSNEDQIKLADFIKPIITINEMKKETLEKLNLADGAQADAIEQAIINLFDAKAASDKKVLELADDVKRVEGEKTDLQKKIDAIELADKTAKKTSFKTELGLALADGRVTESTEKPGTVKQSWLDLFDTNPEATMTMLKGLTPHTSASKMDLGDKKGGDVWKKRQEEIEENAKKK